MILLLFHAVYSIGRLVLRHFFTQQASIVAPSVYEQNDDVSSKLPKEKTMEANNDESDRPAANKEEKKKEVFISSLMPGDDIEETETVRFRPPVYIQRYTTVIDFLSNDEKYKNKIQKMVEFGSAELSFVRYMKSLEAVEEIICVDIDREILERNKNKAQPLYAEYLHERNAPLTVSVYEGSVSVSDKIVQNADAVVAIELIEHLYEETLTAVPANIFGFIKPKVALITTPNAEFNVMFKLTGFRHDDHKFEWTRGQFQQWAQEIVARYPEYQVSFHGIGAGPPGTEHLGCCSQMAVFHRRSEASAPPHVEGIENAYSLVAKHEYPFRIDSRSDEEKILDDAKYYIGFFSSGDSVYAEEVPLKLIAVSIKKFKVSVETLKQVLEQNNYVVESRRDVGLVVVVPAAEWSDSEGDGIWDDDDYETERRRAWDDEPGRAVRVIPRDEAIDENWDEEEQLFVPTVNGSAAENGTRVARNNREEENGRGEESEERVETSAETSRRRRLSLDEETPPESSSPDFLPDSGYPASATDMSPNSPSIAESDSSSSSEPAANRPAAAAALEEVQVENGDLANNNRDYEGNNMMAAQEPDFQPLINVLEIDVENENDIYMLENGFPIWLLRILEMANNPEELL